MKNIEKFKDEIKAELEKNKTLGCVVNKLMGNTCDDFPKCNDCYLKVLDWLLQEYDEPTILTDKEKIIIKNILKAFEPFEIGNVKYIIVKKCDNCYSYECINGYTLEIVLNCCYIKLYYECGSDIANLFKELELDKKYTPKELGLC